MKAISLNSLILAFSKTFDLLDETLHTHHLNVAYISMSIAKKLNLPKDKVQDIILASLLHDIGVFKLKDRINLNGYEDIERAGHDEIGALMLRDTEVLSHLAPLVRYHHTKYHEFTKDAPIEANIIYLADRISVIIDYEKSAEANFKRILNALEADKNTKYFSVYLDTFNKVATEDFFWQDILQNKQEKLIRANLVSDYRIENSEDILRVGQLFVTAVDFRSRFTAAHSYGVAQIALCIGQYLNLDKDKLEALKIAGFYHDIGKIAVPKEILDKPSKLNSGERKVILSHSYYTYSILSSVEGMKQFAEIAAYHHEHIDGSGYPFGLKGEQLSVLARIVAVADVFTAITEIRPYRKSMTKDKVRQVLLNFAHNGKLDEAITDVTIQHFDALYKENMRVQNEAHQRFDTFESEILMRTGVEI